VVIVSALSDMDSVVQGIQLGADDYLPKPFNPFLLEARLNAGLDRKRLRDLEKLHIQSLKRELEIGPRFRIDSGDAEDSAKLLHQAVTRTNQYVCQIYANPLFATLFIGVLDPVTGKIHYINAGHNSPQLIRRNGSREELKPTGAAIGVIEDLEYRVGAAVLGPGEELLVYSDGVEDTNNLVGEFYGRARLLELLALPAKSAAEHVERLAASLLKFMGEKISPSIEKLMVGFVRQLLESLHSPKVQAHRNHCCGQPTPDSQMGKLLHCIVLLRILQCKPILQGAVGESPLLGLTRQCRY
jgi:CheY-like chemotaxis protein